MHDQESEEGKYPWAGPVLFCTVLIGLSLFFWWFVTS